jgi:hypothetical protein
MTKLDWKKKQRGQEEREREKKICIQFEKLNIDSLTTRILIIKGNNKRLIL